MIRHNALPFWSIRASYTPNHLHIRHCDYLQPAPFSCFSNIKIKGWNNNIWCYISYMKDFFLLTRTNGEQWYLPWRPWDESVAMYAMLRCQHHSTINILPTWKTFDVIWMKEDPLGQPTIHPPMKLTKGPERILEGQIILSYFGFLSFLTMMEAFFTLSRSVGGLIGQTTQGWSCPIFCGQRLDLDRFI